jgi:hypothetical protein
VRDDRGLARRHNRVTLMFGRTGKVTWVSPGNNKVHHCYMFWTFISNNTGTIFGIIH